MPKPSISSVLFLVSFVIFLLSCFIMLFSCTNPSQPNGDQPDTTSHNFSWTIDTIGTYGSYLKDVAIIDANNIWAVGEIHTDETDRYDSLGVWQPPFNAVHWDGNEWELLRIPAVTSWGSLSRGPMLAVLAHSQEDVWIFSQAGSYARWNGSQWISEYVDERIGSITKMWGTSSKDMYFVGTNGNITHYDGQSWQRLESGTDIDIQDIWGARNKKDNSYEILAMASTTFNLERERYVLRINDNTVSAIPDSGLAINLSTIWFEPSKTYYAAGDGLYISKNNEFTWKKENDQLGYYKSEIRGNNDNDVFVVGSFGLVSHFNGNSWKHYTEEELPYFYGSWNALSVLDDFVVVVGDADERGLILRGKRN